MAESSPLRKKLADRLLNKTTKIPTTTAGRLSRTALTGLRIGKVMIGNKFTDTLAKAAAGEEVDIEALVRLVGTLGQLKGLVMKMGQILSYIDVALPVELSEALAVLQTQSQPMPIDKVRQIIHEDMGDWAKQLLSTMEEKPIAAASIGQVHKAIIAGQPVAVKVQYPEIEKTIMSDFAPTAAVSKIFTRFYPHAKITEIVQEMRERLLEECDYVHEADAQLEFADLYKDHPHIVVPEIFQEYCSKHVLTSGYVEGISFEEMLAANPSQEKRDEIGKALFKFYIGSLFEYRLYNCDPHPGNYLFMENGKIAVLDYGCVRRFEPEFVKQLAGLTRAVHRDDPEELRQAYLDINIVDPGQEYDFDIVRDLVRGFYGPMLDNKKQKVSLGTMSLKEMMAKKMELNKLALPAEFIFLLRIRFGLMSVLEKLGAEANWKELEGACIALAE